MKDWLRENPVLFQVIQLVYSVYLMFLVYLITNYSYLLLPGIISFILGLGIRKFKIFRIINLYFCSALLFAYILYFYNFLIIRRYIYEIGNPFFLMGLTLHLPVILFNVFVIFSFFAEDKVKIK